MSPVVTSPANAVSSHFDKLFSESEEIFNIVIIILIICQVARNLANRCSNWLSQDVAMQRIRWLANLFFIIDRVDVLSSRGFFQL